MWLGDLRREYRLTGLRRADLAPDPLRQFQDWFDATTRLRGGGRLRRFFVTLYKAFAMLGGVSPLDVNAMTLATVDKLGRASARVVLLKAVDERGFVFFTNYESRKGRELSENPQAALVFYWADMEREVCVAGTVAKLPEPESDAYFITRPRGSRIAAWVSRQSQPVRDRAQLEQQWREYEGKHAGREITRPPFWGGYILQPSRIEFWQGRPNRLHDRFSYNRQPDGSWSIERLSP